MHVSEFGWSLSLQMAHKVCAPPIVPSTQRVLVNRKPALDIFKLYLRSVMISDTEIIMTCLKQFFAYANCFQLLCVCVK